MTYFKRACCLTITFLIALGVFWVKCRFDNKYTHAGLQPSNGLLDVSDYADSPFLLFLRDDWLFYAGQYLSPEELRDGTYGAHPVQIGASGGFEMGDAAASPHGCGTYKLTIRADSTVREYMMELPEIYTRYDLWVDGVLRRSVGTKGAADTQQSRISIMGAGDIEIVIAVADDNYLISGMVYPPAFGDPVSVSKLLDARLLLTAGALALALLVAVLHLVVGANSGRTGISLLYALFCLFFMLTISHTPAHTLGLPGRLWYTLEAAGAYGILWVLLTVCASICHLPRLFHWAFFICGTALCIWACAFPAFYYGDSLPVLLLYSDVLVVWRWVVCLVLLGITSFNAMYGRVGALSLACGLCVYAAALLIDRLVILYEPLLAFWPTETASLLLVLHLAWLHISDTISDWRAKEHAEAREQVAAKVATAQQHQYEHLASNIEDLRLLRHELRHHFLLMQSYCREGRFEDLRSYLTSLSGLADCQEEYCTHPLINAILGDLLGEARAASIDVVCDVKGIPAELPYDDADLCALLVNMLTNAIEACQLLPDDNARWIQFRLAKISTQFVIECVNSCSGPPKRRGFRLITSKNRAENHGYGLGLMNLAVSHCKGHIMYQYRKEAFTVLTTLPLF